MKSNTPESFLRSLLSSGIWRGASQVTKFAKHVVIARAIGLSSQLDGFYMAVAILGMVVFIWGSLLDVIAVPKLVLYRKQGQQDAFDELTGGLFTGTLVFGLLLAGVIAAGSDVMAKVAVGFSEGQRSHLGEALIWLTPVTALYCSYRLLGALFRAVRQFSVFYQAEFLIDLVSTVAIFFFMDSKAVLLWSFSVAMIISFVYLLFHARRQFRLMGSPLSPRIGGLLTLAPALLVLNGATWVFQFAERGFMSYLPVGSVSALAYGNTLATALPGLLALSGSFITIFSEQRASGQEGSETVRHLITLGLFLGLPTTIFLWGFGDRVIALLLQRGQFDAGATSLTIAAVRGYSVGMIPFFLLTACDQVFQVLGRVALMVRRVVIGLIANLVLNSLFMFVFRMGVLGVALATSLSFLFMLFGAFEAFHREGLKVGWPILGSWFIGLISASVVAYMGAAVVGMISPVHWIVFLQGVVFAVIYAAITAALPLEGGKLLRATFRRIVGALWHRLAL